MNPIEAGGILERLTGHWPNLAANDAAADDWIRAIRATTVAHEAADTLVTGWTNNRAPKIADWQETCCSIVARLATVEHRAQHAIEGPPSDRARVAAIIDTARRAVTDASKHAPVATTTPVSKYDQARPPIFWGEKRMTPDERDAELDAFGDRHVRTKHPER